MATIEKRIIYKNSDLVTSPILGGDIVIFRKRNVPHVKFSKDSEGVISQVKPNPSEMPIFISEYNDIYRLQESIKKEGYLKVCKLIFGSCTSELQSNRILNALDNGTSFYVALQTGNFNLAKSRVDVFLALGSINAEDKELILFYVELAEQANK